MALETAGLAIGAIALLSTVKDCVDLFDYISVSRALERDFEILETKLDIEKTLFLQWIERTNVLTDKYDERLDHPQVCAAVSRALNCISVLLSDSEPLRNRYGFVEDSNHGKSDAAPSKLSHPRMNRVIKALQGLDLAPVQKRDLSKRARMRWAAGDREKFLALIKDLSDLISSLDKLVPQKPELVAKMALEDLRSLPSLGTLRLVVDASHGQETTLTSEAEDLLQAKCVEKILMLLWFRAMDDRRNSVKSPHSRTLEWALANSHQGRQWDSIPEWLGSKSQRRIYWLSGKAGSGKSTLMKHMCTHPRVLTYLQSWAGDRNLIVDSFFFWALGMPEQKTYSGLWRAVLYKILSSEPELIPILLPDIWQEVYYSSNEQVAMPTDAEVNFAFGHLVNTVDHKTHYCFFIDGLDEYSGDYEHAIAFIDHLAESPNFKLVISSRPIRECEQAYQDGPKLKLQDLTRPDIALYVEERVSKHPYTQVIMKKDAVRAKEMMCSLVDKSSGVFLWVVLACRSVLQGFNNCDTLDILERRINKLPRELESLFQHILDKIEPLYQEQAALLLWLTYEQYSLTKGRPLTTVGLAVIDEYVESGACNSNFVINAQSPKTASCLVLRERLRSRCQGLLEVVEYDNDAWPSGDYLPCFCLPDKTGSSRTFERHDPLLDSTIQFVHRSVFEFLQMPNVRQLGCLDIRRSSFPPPVFLLAQMSVELHRLSIESRLTRKELDNFIPVDRFMRDTLQCLNQVGDVVERRRAIALLRALDETVTKHEWRPIDSFMTWAFRMRKKLQDLPKQTPALVLMKLLGVRGGGEKTIFDDPFLLYLAIRPQSFSPDGIYYRWDEQLVMMRYLLKSGCKPHGHIDGCKTAWELWCSEMKTRDSVPNRFEVYYTTICLIEANPEEVQLRLLYKTDEDMEKFSQWVQDELRNSPSTKVTPESSRKIFQLIEESKRTA
ncbi:prion-inhibition and propagation-domain-containing protein [Xylariaceae sp. FL1272]|nr:prion-inhibition and propagation-domain-containing protein [Xylariaceae sp. FL1272]